MQRKTRKIIGAVAVIGALAAGGAAFTAANAVPATVAGYGTANVTGATVSTIHYTLDTNGTHITAAHLVLVGDQSANTVKAGFNGGSTVDCSGPVFSTPNSTTDCTFLGGGQLTSGVTDFDVAVTNN